MLKVTINSGSAPERSIYVNDLVDIKVVQDAVLDEFQKVMAQEAEDDKIILQRILEKADCETVSDLDDYIENAVELQDALDSSDYDSIDEMTEAIDGMKDALYEISRLTGDWV
jgi:t-SNARE complex subunit (syntaxin)